ncbi:hypothetical protein [Vagococcus penaei]|uniref:hypothetical protein n=1 Tax=Vagococcus penaei TaxID=633807 RepID=UPI000F86060A|nr:hypothetical protein [Vagococcus penaei]
MFGIKRTNLWRNILVGYWILIPVVFLCYTGMTSLKLSVTFKELLTNTGTFAVGLLLSCLMIVLALMLLMIDKTQVSQHSILGRYLVFAMIQQVLTLNFVGVIIAFFYYRTLPVKSQQDKILTFMPILIMAILLLLSVLMSLISFNLFNTSV